MGTLIVDLKAVLTSNTIVLFAGVLSNFLIPKYLGLSEYAFFKTYGLYVSYVGVLSLGFVDGMYLKYGGLKRRDVSTAELTSHFWFYAGLEGGMSIVLIILSTISCSSLLLAFGLALFSRNILGFYKLFYQAIGEFKAFSAINALVPMLNLTSTIVLIFFVKTQYGTSFIIADLSVSYVVLFLFSAKRLPIFHIDRLDLTDKLRTIAIGVFVMIGNLSSMFFYSMDRWFVKILLRTEDFAFYSFATSMMGMVMILVSSVAMTFYPMLVRRQEEEGLLRSLKSYLMILGVFAGAAYFGFDFIVNLILRDYLPSLEVIAILFAGFPAISVINAIYVNMYKAQKVEKKYFFTVFGMVAVSFSLNVLAVAISKSNWTIAAATTIAFYFWFFFSSKDFKGAKTNPREIAYLSAFLMLFFSTTRLLPWWIGLPLYISGILGITLLFYKKEFLDLIRKVLGAFKIRTSQN